MPPARTASRPSIRYERPWMYRKQVEAIFAPERIACIEASTKAGKTHGCIIWLIEQALGGLPGYQYWWVAPIYNQSRIAYERIKRGLDSRLYKANDGRTMLTYRPNGAELYFKGSDNPDSLYGEDVYAAVIDEASRCKDGTWPAIRSVLTATRGPVRLIGKIGRAHV